MPRIHPVQIDQAQPKAKAMLEGIHKSLGMTPNMLATIAHSPAALKAYTGFGQAMSTATLDASLREQISVGLAGERECGYCASAHTLLGQGAGVAPDELGLNLHGESGDPRVQAALRFTLAVASKQGWVSDEDYAAIRQAGFSEGEVIEIIAMVAINTFSNYLNHIAQTEIDFPEVALPQTTTR